MDPELVELVWRRAGGRCEYCQVHHEHDELHFEIDHIIARKHRGPTRAGNLCLACFACNAHKWAYTSATDPISGISVPLFNPRMQVRPDLVRQMFPIGSAAGTIGTAELRLVRDLQV